MLREKIEPERCNRNQRLNYDLAQDIHC